MDLLVTAEEEKKQDLANRLDPQRVETQNAEMAKQAFKRARHDAHKAASLEPAYDKAWWRLAKANVGLREFTRARRALDRCSFSRETADTSFLKSPTSSITAGALMRLGPMFGAWKIPAADSALGPRESGGDK